MSVEYEIDPTAAKYIGSHLRDMQSLTETGLQIAAASGTEPVPGYDSGPEDATPDARIGQLTHLTSYITSLLLNEARRHPEFVKDAYTQVLEANKRLIEHEQLEILGSLTDQLASGLFAGGILRATPDAQDADDRTLEEQDAATIAEHTKAAQTLMELILIRKGTRIDLEDPRIANAYSTVLYRAGLTRNLQSPTTPYNELYKTRYDELTDSQRDRLLDQVRYAQQFFDL